MERFIARSSSVRTALRETVEPCPSRAASPPSLVCAVGLVRDLSSETLPGRAPAACGSGMALESSGRVVSTIMELALVTEECAELLIQIPPTEMSPSAATATAAIPRRACGWSPC